MGFVPWRHDSSSGHDVADGYYRDPRGNGGGAVRRLISIRRTLDDPEVSGSLIEVFGNIAAIVERELVAVFIGSRMMGR